MFQGIPIIGIVGGVGSGKSHVARLFGELGCLVLDSDAHVTQAYTLSDVLRTLLRWWGPDALLGDGTINRKAIAARVFTSAEERRRLEQLIHPVVARLRNEAMRRAMEGPVPPVAFVWDTPLLFEAGLDRECDAVVFVDAPREVRLRRVRETRGWNDDELTRRENSQWALDKKKALSHYVVTNAAHEAAPARESESPVSTADDAQATADDLRLQVRQVLSSILTTTNGRPHQVGLD